MMKTIVSGFQRFLAFDELLKQLVIRDVKLKYRRSYLGYLWSILNPLMLMMVLVVVFSNIFRKCIMLIVSNGDSRSNIATLV